MTKCDICTILENKEAFKLLYEDDLCFAILHESPAIAGHTLVIPKKHTTIIEELDDKVVDHLFVIANKISSALFDTLGALGTNIILNNGADAGQELPHVVVNVLPRKDNDGINLDWPQKQASDAELKSTKSMLENYALAIYSGKNKLPKVAVKKQKPKEEDYIVKGLKRMP